MRKALSLLLALMMCLSLCACGNNGTANLPQESFYGEWVNYETGDKLIITNSSIVFEYSGGAAYNDAWTLAEINGNILTTSSTGDYEQVEENGYTRLIGETGIFISLEEAATLIDAETLNIGDTAAGDFFELTIKSVEFAERLGSENTTRLFERDVSWDDPGDGKAYMIIKFDYTNLAKETTDLTWDIRVTVVYKDGYEFVSLDEEKAYIFEDDINGSFYQCMMDSGYLMELSPLTSGSYFIAIPVAEIVGMDTESPIKIKFEYAPFIRGGEDAYQTTYVKVQ